MITEWKSHRYNSKLVNFLQVRGVANNHNFNRTFFNVGTNCLLQKESLVIGNICKLRRGSTINEFSSLLQAGIVNVNEKQIEMCFLLPTAARVCSSRSYYASKSELIIIDMRPHNNHSSANMNGGHVTFCPSLPPTPIHPHPPHPHQLITLLQSYLLASIEIAQEFFVFWLVF